MGRTNSTRLIGAKPMNAQSTFILRRRCDAFRFELEHLGNVVSLNHDIFTGEQLLSINEFENTVREAIFKLGAQGFENSNSNAEIRDNRPRKRFYYASRAKRIGVGGYGDTRY